ncbi:GDSL-type esterase/lipase family protein [Salinimonas sediminis]|uniref:Electron transporter RnfD n=1 Tax=Salinimonas sediminis TaxID=2303538 RepID=A0A346NMY7_9ALTE|nr:GDSL-type esterase/lipase family protein [Salinimonas sediminis]AXR06894.1 electron transporter RnfD [Salinimonas sediminis]
MLQDKPHSLKHSIPHWTLCWLLLAGIFSSPLYATVITPDHEGFSYTGRIDRHDATAPVLSWPGSQVQFSAHTRKLSIELDDSRGENYYAIIVDDNTATPFVFQAHQGRHQYSLPMVLEDTVHHFVLYKRTEGEEGDTRFLGIEIDGSMAKAVAKPSRKIEIYGDSVTSGMGNEAAFNSPDHLKSEKNHYLSYGAIAARALSAQLHSISRSGIGIKVGFVPFTMTQYYDQLSAVGDNQTTWDFTAYRPDVVVVNLLQNDHALHLDTSRISPTPTKAEYVQAYKTFLSTLRERYPATPIICSLGSMDAVAPGNEWFDVIEQAVQALSQQGDKALYTLKFDYQGYGAHPRLAHHAHNAQLLEDKIRNIMGW